MTYDGDVVDGCVMVEQNARAVDVVALDAHVQRRQSVLGLGGDRRSAFQQQVHHLVVSAACGTVQRSQPVLQQQQPAITLRIAALHCTDNCTGRAKTVTPKEIG